jgi:hypothetical protein
VNAEDVRVRAAGLVNDRGPGMVAAVEGARVGALHELARVDVPALCDALETATKRAADWREKAEELAACALRIMEERDIARGLSIEAALMLRRVGPVGNEYCLVCGDGHTEGCAFVALLAKLEAP